jgi:ATP-dependent exoDNAse (exonuclease V) beta subunit
MENAADKAPSLRPFLDKLHGLQATYQEKPFGEFVKAVLETRSEAVGAKGDSLMFHHARTDGKNGEKNEKGDVRRENLEELVSAAARFESRFAMNGAANGEDILNEFLAEAALMVAMEGEEQSDMVSLMTIHKSKGLEFGHVFVVGCEEGVFPSMKDRDPRHEELCNMEEERRLFYVAGTRAKHGLCLSSCQSRMLYGQTQWLEPSRFISEIPAHLIQGVITPRQGCTSPAVRQQEDSEMVDFKKLMEDNRNKSPEEREAEREQRNQAFLAEARTRADNRNRHIFRLAEDPRLNEWERDFIAQMAVRAERDIRDRDSGAIDPFSDGMIDKIREIALRYSEVQAKPRSKEFEPG